MNYVYHVSDQPDIQLFKPRKPTREDMNPEIGLVWAIDIGHIANFMTPRNVPRIGFSINKDTSCSDIATYLGHPKEDDLRQGNQSGGNQSGVVAIEKRHWDEFATAELYVYAFDASGFVLQDACAGYYISETPQKPLKCEKVTDLHQAIHHYGRRLLLVDNLWPLARKIIASTFDWSLCRMAFATDDVEISLLPFAPALDFRYAVIAAYTDKGWLYVRHKERATWEIPGGRRELGESIDQTAHRELFEETGAIDYSLIPLCPYHVTRNLDSAYGMLYIAQVIALGPLPDTEIAEMQIFRELPPLEALTYPAIQPYLYTLAKSHLPTPTPFT